MNSTKHSILEGMGSLNTYKILKENASKLNLKSSAESKLALFLIVLFITFLLYFKSTYSLRR